MAICLIHRFLYEVSNLEKDGLESPSPAPYSTSELPDGEEREDF